MKIPLHRILPNPEQPRVVFDAESLDELAQSIRSVGIVQPITVEQVGDNFILHDGERRCRAAKLAGLVEIPAHIVHSNGQQLHEKRLLRALVANLQRQDLNPIEEGESFQRLAEMGMSNISIANDLGKSLHYVANRRALTELEPEIQDLIAARLFPVDKRATEALKSVPDEIRVEFAKKLSRPRLNIKTVQRAAEKLNAALQAQRSGDQPAHQYAAKRSGNPILPKWDALHQLGQLPSWKLVVKAANDTCRACVLRQEASEVVCGDCPAVVMLANMIEATHE